MQKKRLFILGAGGFGRELEDWLYTYPHERKDWELEGYLDDNPEALHGFNSKFGIVGSIVDFRFKESDYVIIAIADNDIKERIYNLLKGSTRFLTFIHPSAVIGSNVILGEGTVIYPNTVISTNCRTGKLVSMGCGNHIGHDSVIGDFSSLMASVDLGGGVNLGSKVYVGSKATIVPQVKIADGAKISSGSVVINNIKHKATYFGNPASKI